MANTDLIAPIVVAIIGLLGSIVSIFISRRSQQQADEKAKEMAFLQSELSRRQAEYQNEVAQKQTAYQSELTRKQSEYQTAQNIKQDEFRKELDKEMEDFKAQLARKQTVSNLTDKYGQPLLVAAYDLQHRLYALVEYPVSRQQLEKPEGLEDLKIFTCYLLAQYLALSYVLRTKTGYMSFSEDKNLKRLRNLMYMIDEELDRRRDIKGRNVGVWPAARLLICERMIKTNVAVNEALDGGFGFELKGYDAFRTEWKEGFREPMGYFCEWIDWMLEGRIIRANDYDAPMRCLQHLIVDLVDFLDRDRAYILKTRQELKCNASAVFCDCSDCDGAKPGYNALKFRQDSRLTDAGLWPAWGLQKKRTDPAYDPSSDKMIKLNEARNMTYTVDLE